MEDYPHDERSKPTLPNIPEQCYKWLYTGDTRTASLTDPPVPVASHSITQHHKTESQPEYHTENHLSEVISTYVCVWNPLQKSIEYIPDLSQVLTAMLLPTSCCDLFMCNLMVFYDSTLVHVCMAVLITVWK